MNYERVFYVVAANDAGQANRVLEEAGFGAGAISAPLCASDSPDGTAPSHFWSSWAISEEDEAKALACLSAAGLEDGLNLWRLVMPAAIGDDLGALSCAGVSVAARNRLAAARVEMSEPEPPSDVADFLAGLGLQRCVKPGY